MANARSGNISTAMLAAVTPLSMGGKTGRIHAGVIEWTGMLPPLKRSQNCAMVTERVTESVEALKLVRCPIAEKRNASSAHDHHVPRPGDVLNPLPERQSRRARVKLVKVKMSILPIVRQDRVSLSQLALPSPSNSDDGLHHLQLSGAKICYLIRPHRAKDLQNRQILYCHDDNSLKTFEGYDYITDPSELFIRGFDYIILALDGAALRNRYIKLRPKFK
ncbi:hypothetical protein IL306_009370 [Fusarium sp. DS 682]|nr:hypothetical protein IL306_009370 [Fusarium sp. DS 682]